MSKLKIVILSMLAAIPLMAMSGVANAHRYHCHYACHTHYWCGCYGVVNRVVANLRANPATADQPIWVSSQNGRVTLSGRVGTEMQRATAVYITRYTCGVRLVYDALYLSQP